MIKLTKSGFSAIEVVVAVVAVVVVAGLGYFAYSNSQASRPNDSNSSQTEDKIAEESGTDGTDIPDKADAAWSYYGGLKVDSLHQMLMAVCKVGTGKYKKDAPVKVTWAVGPKWSKSKTYNKPWVFFYSDAVNQPYRAKKIIGPNTWWSNYVTQTKSVIPVNATKVYWGFGSKKTKPVSVKKLQTC